MTQALAGFEAGGFTGGSEGGLAGLVHGGEYVFSAPAVRNIGVANLDNAHTMAKSASFNGAASGGDTTQSFHMHADHNAAFRAAMRDPANKRMIIDTHRMAARHV
jgi:hypothetical protein